MSHDYKHYAQPKPGPLPIPLWVWIFAIVMVSGFVGLLYYLELYEKGRIGTDHEANLKKIITQQLPPVISHTPESKPPATEKVKASQAEKDKQDEKTTSFDFYSLLPAMKVIIPGREEAVPDTEIPKHDNSNNTIPFVLQAGSFKDPQQADRLKAGLALMGIESSIESVTIKDSGTWHRVRIGPFTNMKAMEKIRAQMRANKIDPILLRDKS